MELGNYNPSKVGATLTFADGLTPKQVGELLDRLNELAGSQVVETQDIQTFDPNWGFPVFYVP